MEEKEGTTNINDMLKQLNDRANMLYKHVWLHSEYATHPRDYGTGQLISEVEVHTISTIEEHEGMTITELARESDRTKGAISQIINKLENKGYVIRRKFENNSKTVRLFLTPEGRNMSSAHKAFDRVQVTEIINELLKECTMSEIDSFYKVLACRNKIVERRYLEKKR